MFKLFFVFVSLVAVQCSAAAVSNSPKNVRMFDEPNVEILKSVSERKPDGSYMFAYEGADGSARQESARVNAETDDDVDVLEVSGSYRYIDADGQPIEVQYTAGKNGFIVQGTNIPQEITVAVKEAAAIAEYARRHPDVKLKANKSA